MFPLKVNVYFWILQDNKALRYALISPYRVGYGIAIRARVNRLT